MLGCGGYMLGCGGYMLRCGGYRRFLRKIRPTQLWVELSWVVAKSTRARQGFDPLFVAVFIH